MSNCNCHTKTITDGSGQLGRYLKALDPAYAPIDDRSIKDLLVFAKRYAAQVRFYDVPGEEPEGDIKPAQSNWREFFRRDMAVIAASIGVLDIANMKAEYDELRERLDEEPSVEKFFNRGGIRKKIFRVNDIITHPAVRNRGLGTALLDTFVRQVRDYHFIEIWIAMDNWPMINIASRCGFRLAHLATVLHCHLD